MSDAPTSIIERAAYAAIGHVDCRPRNAHSASQVIAKFVLAELEASGYAICTRDMARTLASVRDFLNNKGLVGDLIEFLTKTQPADHQSAAASSETEQRNSADGPLPAAPEHIGR